MAGQHTGFYVEQGGNRAVVASGGEIDIESGGALKIAGTAVSSSAATLNLVATGVAAGYKIARGVDTPTGGSDTIATGLSTVVAVVVSLEDEPTLTHMWSQGDAGDQAGSPAAGSFILTSSKPTASNDVTPIAATTPWSPVHWIAIGT